MNLRARFSDAELNKIKDAVHRAEERISGEIVPVIVEKSGYYTIANYKGSLIMAALGMVVLVAFDRYFPALAVYDPLMFFILIVLCGLAGWALPQWVPWARRKLLTRQHMDHATKQKAENAFLEEEVFNTRHRTGIMIFISFFEHEVIIMADRGINKVVEQKEWDKIVRDLTESIDNDRVVAGTVAAIARCGDLLHEKGFVKSTDDVNELRDDLRIN